MPCARLCIAQNAGRGARLLNCFQQHVVPSRDAGRLGSRVHQRGVQALDPVPGRFQAVRVVEADVMQKRFGLGYHRVLVHWLASSGPRGGHCP